MALKVACINLDKAGVSGDRLVKVFATLGVDLGIVLEPPRGMTWEKRRTEFGDYQTIVVTAGLGFGIEPIVFFWRNLDVQGRGPIDTRNERALAQFRVPVFITVQQDGGRLYKIAGFHAPCTNFDGNATVVMSKLTKKDGPLESNAVQVLLADTNQSAQARIGEDPLRGQAYSTLLQVATAATANKRRPGFYDRILALPAIGRPPTWQRHLTNLNHKLIGITLP